MSPNYTYDPESEGAECQRCALGPNAPSWLSGRDSEKAWLPVPPRRVPGSQVLVIGEAPGEQEVEQGVPFVGDSGQVLGSALQALGRPLKGFALDNAGACHPVNNQLDRLTLRVTAANDQLRTQLAQEQGVPKTRVEMPADAVWLLPWQACRVRLLAHARQYPYLYLLGRTALDAVLGDARVSVMEYRGRPIELGLLADGQENTRHARVVMAGPDGFPAGAPLLHRWKAMVALHPAHILRQARWQKIFQEDLAKGWRHFSNTLAWRAPLKVFRPSLHELEAFLSTPRPNGRPFIYDIETGPGDPYPGETLPGKPDKPADDSDRSVKLRLGPLRARIRCIAIGDYEAVYVVPLLGIDGQMRFYTPQEEWAIRRRLAQFLADPSVPKGGWNCLALGSRVVMADGRTVPIETVVRTRDPGPVLALRDGKVVAAKVSAWHRARVPNQEWIAIRRVGEKTHSRGLTLTPEHLVWTQRGWSRADAVRRGDRLFLPERLDAAPLEVEVESVTSFRLAVSTRYCLTTSEGNFFTTFGLVKNCTGYDDVVLEGGDEGALLPTHPLPSIPGSRVLGSQRPFRVQGTRDYIYDHHLIEEELGHSLGEAASYATDAPCWKTNEDGKKLAVSARTDRDLWSYAADDVAVESFIGEGLERSVRDERLEHLSKLDRTKGEMCTNLHRIGLRINQRVREELEGELRTKTQILRVRCQELAGRPRLNPQSPDQVAELLHGEWGLPIKARTEKYDEASVSDGALIALYAHPELTPTQRAFVRTLRALRATQKLLSTFVVPLRPRTIGGYVDPDGRIRTGWLAFVVVSGRLATSRPLNLHGYPVSVRKCFEPEPGHVFVMADKDQLELRIASAIAKCPFYLRMFAEGGDPHWVMAEHAFGDIFRNAPGTKKTGAKGKLRGLSKTTVYTSLYGAEPETVHQRLVSAEDDFGELVNANLAQHQTTTLYQAWLTLAPEFPDWWKAEVDRWRQRGYVEDVVLKRRIGCQENDQGDRSKIVNSVVQSTAAASVDLETMEFLHEYPYEFAGPYTGLVVQQHDSLVAEVPESQAERIRDRMTAIMTKRYEALPDVVLTAEAEIAKCWK